MIFQATIAASGDGEAIRVLESENPLLDAAAVSAVARWRYRPPTRNGRAVAVYRTDTVKFGIDI